MVYTGGKTVDLAPRLLRLMIPDFVWKEQKKSLASWEKRPATTDTVYKGCKLCDHKKAQAPTKLPPLVRVWNPMGSLCLFVVYMAQYS